MAIQTFTSGQTLTAAQMTSLQANDYNQTVSTKTTSYTLAIGDLGTRVVMNSASATTITVNTSIFAAGDTLFIQNIGAGVCTVTAGTCTVGTSGTLALVQNAGGTLYFTSASAAIFIASGVTATAGGLTLITAQTIGSAVSSVTVSNCFSATYNNYKILVSGGVGSASNYLRMTLGAATTRYSNKLIYGTVANNTVSGLGNSLGAYWDYVGSFHTTAQQVNIDLYNPFLSTDTQFTSFVTDIVYDATNLYGTNSGTHDIASSYTGFTLTTAGGTLTGGKVYVYGYALS